MYCKNVSPGGGKDDLKAAADYEELSATLHTGDPQAYLNMLTQWRANGEMIAMMKAQANNATLYPKRGAPSYRTNRRTTEVGTRMPVGAQRGQVLWMAMRDSMLMSIGTAAGLPLAVLCVRFLSSMLYQLSPFDSLSFVLATCCVAFVGGVAVFLPAWHAAKVDPMVALR